MGTNTRFLTTIKKGGAGKDKDRKLSIILLNAAPGYCMKSYGPKCLLKINDNVSVIEAQIEILKRCYPNSEIISTIGFEAEKVVKRGVKNVRYVENQLFESTHTVEEIKLALNNCETDDVMIIYGDVVFNQQAVDNITKDGSTLVCVNNHNLDEDGIGVTMNNDNASILSYGINPKWSYIVYFCGKELNSLRRISMDKEKAKLYPFELINLILEKGSNKIKVFTPSNGKIMKIESIKDVR